MKFALRFIILAAVVFALPYVVSGISVSGPVVALIVALIFAFVNVVIKPILSIVTLPITIVTLGVSSLIINALLFWAISFVITGFGVSTFVAALIGSLILSIANWFLGLVLSE